MSRIEAADVSAILNTTIADSKIEIFITTANAIVTQYLGSSSLSDSVLAEIEKQITAHLLTVPDPNLKASKIDVLTFTFRDIVGFGLSSTTYGQTAILLDSTGVLSDVAETGSTKSISIGSIDYNDNN